MNNAGLAYHESKYCEMRVVSREDKGEKKHIG